MSESVPTDDAPTSSSSPLDDVQAALDAGDWASARKQLANVDPESLGEGGRARYDQLSAQLSPDFAAIFVAGAIGFVLLAILAALYM